MHTAPNVEPKCHQTQTIAKYVGGAQHPIPLRLSEFIIGDWRKTVTIKNGEYVIFESTFGQKTKRSREVFEGLARIFNLRHKFVLTNQRLISLGFKLIEESDGKTVLSLELQKEFPVESIKDASHQNRKITIYTDEETYDVGLIVGIRQTKQKR